MRTKLLDLILLTLVTLLVTMIGVSVEAHPGGLDVCGGHVETINGMPTYHTHNRNKLKNCERIFKLIQDSKRFSFIVDKDTGATRVFVD